MKNNKIKKILFWFLNLFLIFNISFAQTINGIVEKITEIVLKLGKFLFLVAFLFFIWNIVGLMFSLSGKDHQKYKDRVLWSVIIIFVLVSFWGIVVFMQNTVKLNNYKTNLIDSSDFTI